MQFTTVAKLESRKAADLLILPFYQKEQAAYEAADFSSLQASYAAPLSNKDFLAKESELLFTYHHAKQEQRVALLGLGKRESLSVETLRRAFATLARACLAKKIKSINLVLPTNTPLSDEELLRGVLEGVLLANYSFTKLKSASKGEDSTLIEKINLLGSSKPKQALEQAKKHLIICNAVSMVRDLVNDNADEVTPQRLGLVAKELAAALPNSYVKVFGKKEIEKENLGLLLAVNRGSHIDPAFIVLTYKGDPKSKEVTALVGKGVTYDTGGLNIKPTGSMESMKCDMAGAATALGAFYAIASLGIKINLTVIIPATENSIGSKSYKPGDVYTGLAGKSVEIGNTDAEGRLILADALSYVVKKIKPSRIIDFATLTGAIDVALGAEASGLFANDDMLANQLIKAGEETFERVWQLPLFPEYREQLKSEFADIKNVGGRSAGSITAALFLKEFVGDTPWAHLDIASTAYLNESKRYHPKRGTGVGVRLMVQFFENLSKPAEKGRH